jgi:DNA gyrase subunit A
MLALVDSQPRTLSLKRLLEHYIAFRREVIRRRSEFELARAKDREHILQGLLTALQNLDQVIQAIRRASSGEAAKERLMKPPFRMSDRQAQAVLDMQRNGWHAWSERRSRSTAGFQQIGYLKIVANPAKSIFVKETL